MRLVGLFRKRKNVPELEEQLKREDKKSDDAKTPDRLPTHEEAGPKEPQRIDVLGGPITSLVFLADGKHLVGSCRDGSIRRWRVSDWHEVGPAMKSDGAVNAIASSRDGKWIVSGGVDRKVTVWNTTNHQKVGELAEQYSRGVTALDIPPDSSCVAVGSECGSVIIWCLETGELVAGPSKHQESQVSSVKFSPTGDRLASACTGWDCDSVRIWHGRTGDLLACLSADNKPTYSLAWSCDGQQLFAGGPRGSIRCFNTATQSVLSRLGDQLSDSVTSLHVSNNDRFLVAGSASACSLNLWDLNTCQLIHPTLFESSEVLTVAISPDNHLLVAGTKDRKVSTRSLSSIVPVSYFFHRLAPTMRHSEPFTYMSKAVHEAWTHGKWEKVEELLSKEIINQDCPELVAYSLANRALVRARLHKWDQALEDARTKLPGDVDVPLITHIVKGFALTGQGSHQGAREEFGFALRICDDEAKPFIVLIKFILLFEIGHRDEDEVICFETDPVDCFFDVKSTRSVVKAQMLVLLAERYIVKQNYDKAIQLLSKAQDLGPFVQVPELRTISLIFDWNLDDLHRIIHQQKCKALFAAGRTREAIDFLLVMQTDLEGEVETRGKAYQWLIDFKKECLDTAESLGEEAMRNNDYDGAIAWCSAALDLNSESPERIFLKRSGAYAAKGTWEDALMDANEAITRNAALPQAYEMKRRALQNLEQYDEVIKILKELPDGELRHQHTKARAVIDEIVKETLHNVPLRMIDTESGRLCDESRLRSVFEADRVFRDLVVSMTECVDTARIKHVVKEFFRYVMFSHRWQQREPLFGDVGDQSVYSLPTEEMPTVLKLQTFCRTAGKAGYRWAWSDTCCIDKNNQREFEKCINSMFRWYHHSSLTLVYLWDVAPSLVPGGLTQSEWITRGWTLQELLAPPVIRFLNADWRPYLSDSNANSKESDVIMGEIANAVGVPATDLLSFRPSSDDIRWKLRMASKRDTKEPEDAAYCLFGIFSVVMSVIPGELQYQAVGRLLREVITCSKSGDVGCLAWAGNSSELNTCLPTQVKAYEGPCRTPASIGEEDIQRLVSEMESLFTNRDQAQALALYHELACQPRAEFAGWRLRLPCIAFRVAAFDADRVSGSSTEYNAKATALEMTRICTTDKFQSKGLLLVYPWIHELLDPTPPRDHRDENDFDSASDDHSAGRAESINEDPSESFENSCPSTPSSLLPSPSASFNERTRMLGFVAHLRQPMTALLLSAQRPGVYKRVATDHEIIIQLRKDVALDRIAVKVIEII